MAGTSNNGSSSTRRTSTASSDSFTAQITSVKLNGPNYSAWAQAIRSALQARNMMNFILSDPPPCSKTSMPYEKWQSDDCLVILWLWNSMKPAVSSYVMHFVTAKEVWRKVRDMYSFDLGRNAAHARPQAGDIASQFSFLSIKGENSVWHNSVRGGRGNNHVHGGRGGGGFDSRGPARGADGGRRGHGRGGPGHGRDGFRRCTICGGENHTVETCRDRNWDPWEDRNRFTHAPTPTTEKWKRIQDFLKQWLITRDDFTWKLPNPKILRGTGGRLLKYVGGVDVSFLKEDSSIACATLVVLDIPTLEVVYQDFAHVTLHVPYVAGFLAFREAPILVDLLEKMKASNNALYPQILMVDGNGLLHPRGFGLACHLGVLANIPTIGIGKNLHYVDGLSEPGVWKLFEENAGEDFITLKGRSGCKWGAAMRPTEDTSKPIFISIGHRVSLDTAVEIVKLTCKYRVPEPVRQADSRSRDYIRRHKREMISNAVS
uniref:Endonuclease V isoform X1 n=1 Tax=Rhizophora mucronata TaxID=61149 RepID=A0A2P2JUG6_RHIMU